MMRSINSGSKCSIAYARAASASSSRTSPAVPDTIGHGGELRLDRFGVRRPSRCQRSTVAFVSTKIGIARVRLAMLRRLALVQRRIFQKRSRHEVLGAAAPPTTRRRRRASGRRAPPAGPATRARDTASST